MNSFKNKKKMKLENKIGFNNNSKTNNYFQKDSKNYNKSITIRPKSNQKKNNKNQNNCEKKN